jgi:hypothetical protein
VRALHPARDQWINVMNDNDTDDLDRTEEEIHTYEVSDEAMEAASGTHNGGPTTLSYTYCLLVL